MKKLLLPAIIAIALLTSCNNTQEELHNKMIATTTVFIQDGEEVNPAFVDPLLLDQRPVTYWNDEKDTLFYIVPSENVVNR